MNRYPLSYVIQQAQDLYLRSYAKDNEFWSKENFKASVIPLYAKLLNDEYQDKKTQNRVQDGYSYIELSPSWLTEEVVTPKKDADGSMYIQTKYPVFEFTFDGMSQGINNILPVSDCSCQCGDIIRLSNKDLWKYKRLPKNSNLFWAKVGEKIVFPCSQCVPEQLKVSYIQSLTMESDEDCVMIPEPYITIITTTILNQLFAAKQGSPFVDKTNDQNANILPVAEANQDFSKQ